MKLLGFKLNFRSKAKTNLQKNKGFTLLEILVVISIIGILIALGATAFSVAQRKSRDARRQGDLKQMQNAFEQYYAIPENNSSYAACATMATSTFPSGLLPTDPKGGDHNYNCQSSDSDYCVCVLLESGTGNGADNGTSSTCTYAVGGTHYCVSNLQ